MSWNIDDPQSFVDFALWERAAIGVFSQVGPLTRDDSEREAAYNAYCVEREAEYEREQAAGGRLFCGDCQRYSIKVIPCSNGVEPSTLYRCQTDGCGFVDFAG